MIRRASLLASAAFLAGAEARTEPPSPQQCRWNPASRLKLQGRPTCGPLVDDSTAAESGSWEPWAYPPHCVSPSGRDDAGKYCVYTYPADNGEAGVSLVAVPETASLAAGILSARSEPWGEPPSWQLSPSERQRAYKVVNIPGKEQGVVAVRWIRAGEAIMRETPFVVGFTSGPEGIRREESPELLRVAFERLPGWHAERLRGVAVSTGGEWHEDAMRTNAFGVDVGGVELSALYPEIARLNHACRPNAFTRYSRTTLQMEIVARRDVEPGEEMTITYIPQILNSEERKKLISHRGFTCTCPICSSPESTASSDANMARIQSILETLRDLGARRTEKVLDGLWANMVAVLTEESLHSHIPEFALLWADLYWVVGAREKARRLAETALAERIFYLGEDSERVEKARVLVKKFGD